MTGEEIIQELIKQEAKNNSDNYINCDSYIEWFAYVENGIIENVGRFKQIHQQGGEGQGDYWHSIKYFEDHDVYIKVRGFYSSYNGTSFDSIENNCSVVRPVLKEVTFYE